VAESSFFSPEEPAESGAGGSEAEVTGFESAGGGIAESTWLERGGDAIGRFCE
jgi:hypothetical protein